MFNAESVEFMSKVLDNAGLEEKVKRKERENGDGVLFALRRCFIPSPSPPPLFRPPSPSTSSR